MTIVFYYIVNLRCLFEFEERQLESFETTLEYHSPASWCNEDIFV